MAIHLDAVYFTWATRFHYPQWLLAVMAFSGAYKHDFVDQIQVRFPSSTEPRMLTDLTLPGRSLPPQMEEPRS